MSSAQPLLRFLALVERELGAHEARLELSAHEPTEDVIWAPIAHGFRVVALVEVEHDVADMRARLASLVESFAGVLAEATLPSVRESVPSPASTLEEALADLAHRARAESAWVIDDTTPEIWGGSLPHEGLNVEAALRFAKLAAVADRGPLSLSELAALGDRLRPWLADHDVAPTEAREVESRLANVRGPLPDGALLRMLRALGAVRGGPQAPEPRVVRRFAGIYELVLVFSGPYSELHAEGAILKMLPLIERLVTALPPRDPVGAGGAKVAVLRRLRRV